MQNQFRGMILLVAVGIMMSAAFLVLTLESSPNDPIENTPVGDDDAPDIAVASPTPEISLTLSPSPTIYQSPTATIIPTAQPEQVSTLAGVSLDTSDGEVLVRRADAYTVYNGKERSDIVYYTVQRGDHLRDIAGYFGLQMETIIWSNDRFYVNAMRPGMELTILPVDGALHHVQRPESIKTLAEEYEVDPYTIIDTDFNKLRDATPESILPVGLTVIIPGGKGSTEPIYWEPAGGATTQGEPTGSFGETSIFQGHAKFGSGQPGSCGMQAIYDGTMPIINPVSGYVVTQNFGWNHGGIDLSVPEGTPVKAVGGGTVIFVGWSDWGYGYSIVIAHGPVMTLYAHLNGPGFVWCGQQVESGQHIGNSGNTGWSSGPHLHFEVRNAAGVPQDPRDYLWFAALR